MVTSPTHSRAACHLLHALLAKGLVKYHNVAEAVSAIITSPELSGPAILADSTLSLMTHLLHIRNMEMPGASSTASQTVIRWAFSRWNPSKAPPHCVKYLFKLVIKLTFHSREYREEFGNEYDAFHTTYRFLKSVERMSRYAKAQTTNK